MCVTEVEAENRRNCAVNGMANGIESVCVCVWIEQYKAI